MLAARDQENLVHGHQVRASSKPLNQGAATVAPKTPAIKTFKTPHKAPLHDENEAGAPKTSRQVPLKSEGKAGGGIGQNTFVTPFGPRSRAPLGQKTTNAKAKASQTPALALNKGGAERDVPPTKGSVRTKESKLLGTEVPTKDAETEGAGDDLEEREIEYMPPKPNDLPDLPDDVPVDIDYHQLRGANLTRGWHSTYCNPLGDDDLSLFERELQERQTRLDQDIYEQAMKALNDMPLLGYNVPEFSGDETILGEQKRREAERKQQKEKTVNVDTTGHQGPSTALAAQAAALLSGRSEPATKTVATGRPLSTSSSSTAVSKKSTKTPTSKSRLPFSVMRAQPKAPLPPTNPSPMRHTAAVAASKSTMGYSKGRAVSNTLAANARRLPSTTTSSTRTVSTSVKPGGAGIRNNKASSSVQQQRNSRSVAATSESRHGAAKSTHEDVEYRYSRIFCPHLYESEDEDEDEKSSKVAMVRQRTTGLTLDHLKLIDDHGGDHDDEAAQDFELSLPFPPPHPQAS